MSKRYTTEYGIDDYRVKVFNFSYSDGDDLCLNCKSISIRSFIYIYDEITGLLHFHGVVCDECTTKLKLDTTDFEDDCDNKRKRGLAFLKMRGKL